MAADGGSGTYTAAGETYDFDLVNAGTAPWQYFSIVGPAGTSFTAGATAGESTVRCLAGQPDGLANEIECGPVSAAGLGPGSHILFVAVLSAPPACGAPFQLDVSATGLAPFTRVGDATSAGSCSAAPPTALTPPVVHGSPVVGGILAATAPAWSAAPARVTYRWQLCTAAGCRPIPEATRLRIQVSRGDAGHTVRIVATATFDAVVVTSASARVAVRARS